MSMSKDVKNRRQKMEKMKQKDMASKLNLLQKDEPDDIADPMDRPSTAKAKPKPDATTK